MRLWQYADASGKLCYSLISALNNVAKVEEDVSVLSVPSVTSIKIEKTEDQSDNWRPSSCKLQDTTIHEDSLMHSHKMNVDNHACDRCGMKFPMRTMLNRHKITHNVRSRFHEKRSSKAKYNSQHPSSRIARRRPVAERLEVRKQSSETGKYGCVFCKFRCNRLTIMNSHLKGKHKESTSSTDIVSQPKINCVICGYECSSETNLTKHVRKHRNKNTMSFTCDICDFECKRSTTLASHVTRSHVTSKKIPATRAKKRRRIMRCDSTSAKKTALIPYENSKLVIKEEISAEDCNEDTSDASRRVNQRNNIGERCDLCDFTCTKKSTLYSHKRRHKAEDIDEVYACNECGFKTSKKSSLYSHVKRKHREPRVSSGGDAQPELFYCSQCDYKNKNKYELKIHVARKHSDDFKFSCETCGKKFKVKGDLTNHIRFSHREQPVICDVCGKTCLNSNSLYVHQKFAHYKAKYECQICKRRMVSQENLNEHMLRQHERRENVVCEECGKTFSRNSRLKVHMRIHTGDKPYSCTVCSKSFARRTALKQHLLIHTGIRPYVCDICGKAFTQKPGLISHRKSHPGSHPPLPRVLIDHILNDVMNA